MKSKANKSFKFSAITSINAHKNGRQGSNGLRKHSEATKSSATEAVQPSSSSPNNFSNLTLLSLFSLSLTRETKTLTIRSKNLTFFHSKFGSNSNKFNTTKQHLRIKISCSTLAHTFALDLVPRKTSRRSEKKNCLNRRSRSSNRMFERVRTDSKSERWSGAFSDVWSKRK